MNNKKRYQKIFVNDDCVVDFTEQTIEAAKVLKGEQFFNRTGNIEEGTLIDYTDPYLATITRAGLGLCLTIPQGVSEIGSYAFSNFTNSYTNGVVPLARVVLPEGVNTLKTGAFAYSGISFINFPSTLNTISAYAFENCCAPVLTLPNTIKQIENSAFFCANSSKPTLFRCQAPEKPAGWDSSWNGYGESLIIWDCDNNDRATDDYIYITRDSVIYKLVNDYAVAWNLEYGAEHVVIPEQIEYKGTNYPVSEIDSYFATVDAYYGCGHTSLKSIVIGANVETIGENVLTNCASLRDITFGPKIKNIGYNFLYNCKSLNKVILPQGLECSSFSINYTPQLAEIYNFSALNLEDSIISSANSQFSIKIYTTDTSTSNLFELDNYRFYRDPDTEELYLLGYIGDNTCSQLILPNSVQGENYHIADCAFYSVPALSTFEAPDNILSYGTDLFYSMQTMNLTTEDSNVYVGSSQNPYAILIKTLDQTKSEVTINPRTKAIYSNAFYNNKTLKKLNLGSVTCIGSYAFYGCSNLEEIEFGPTLKRSGGYAFSNCSKITTVRYSGNISDWCRINFQIESRTCVSNPLAASSKAQLILTEEIPAELTVTEIHGGTFCGWPQLQKVICGPSIKNIPDYAFYRSGISEAVCTSAESIGTNAFRSCANLTKVTLSTALKNFGSYVFGSCNNLTQIHYGGTVEDWCTINFESYILPTEEEANPGLYFSTGLLENFTSSTIDSINAYSFAYYKKLKTVTINSSLDKLNNWAFYGCSNLTTVVLPDTLVSIDNAAFYNCKALTSITLSDNLQDCDGNAFLGCDSLGVLFNNAYYIGTKTNPYCVLIRASSKDISSVTISSSTKFIAINAFEECTNLTSINIPGSVKEIDQNIASGCPKLTTIITNAGTTSISSYAFTNCPKLTTVVLGPDITKILYSAFYSSNYTVGTLTIYAQASTPPKIDYNVFTSGAVKAIKVPTTAAVTAYKAASNWSSYSSKISQGVYTA